MPFLAVGLNVVDAFILEMDSHGGFYFSQFELEWSSLLCVCVCKYIKFVL